MFFKNVKNKILHFEVQNWKGVFCRTCFLASQQPEHQSVGWPMTNIQTQCLILWFNGALTHTHTHGKRGGERKMEPHTYERSIKLSANKPRDMRQDERTKDVRTTGRKSGKPSQRSVRK